MTAIGDWFASFIGWGDPIWPSIGGPPPNDRRELGRQAKQLLEDPVLHLALLQVEDNLIRTWKASDPADHDGRERVYAAYQGMQRFRAELQRMVGNASEKLGDANQ